MKLAQLTSTDLIMLDAVFEDRFEAIHALTDRLDQHGKLSDKQKFLDTVLKRENEGPTALGEYLAVPHGKSEGVKEAVFACAFVKDELMWQGLDGDEPVNMIFLLAIPPAEAGSTHMEVLTTLTSSLVEDEFREQLLAARSAEEIMGLFGEDKQAEEEAPSEQTYEQEYQISCTQTEESFFIQHAYPIVLGAGVLITVALFTLL